LGAAGIQQARMSHMQEVEDPVGEDDATSVRARLPEGTDECVTCDNLAHDRDSRHICASMPATTTPLASLFHPTPSPPYLYARSSQGPPDLYVRCAHEARRPRSIYASLGPIPTPPDLYALRFQPHPEGITPECRSVGEVELRFRGTIRPERPHRLSDPPPRQPDPSLSACPPITPYLFYTLRWASLRSPPSPLPVAPIIYMLAALTRAGFICSLLTKAHRP